MIPELISSLYIGDTERVVCPSCSPDRKKHRLKELIITRKPEGFVYHCHHCGIGGIAPLNNKPFKIKEHNVIPLKQLPSTKLETQHYDFLQTRGISARVADEMKLFPASKYFTRLNRETDAIGFPYFRNGVYISAKYRSIESKDFTQDAGGAHDFFGIDHIDTTLPVVIVEGEIDALTLMECGIKNVLSVPSGAPMKVTDGKIDASEDKRFAFVWNAFDMLKAVPYVTIATDTDTAGQALAEELARRIGKDKCRIATFSYKDLNEAFLDNGVGGADIVKGIIDSAEPYPVAGLSSANKYLERLNDLWGKGNGKGTSTGYSNVDQIYTIAQGQLTIVTGYPSSGKSNFVDQLMVNLAREHDWKFAICSFENQPEVHISRLMEINTEKRFFDGNNKMSEDEKDTAFKWVENHFLFLDSEGAEPSSIDSILERARVAVARTGIRGLVIDPYNYIENKSGVAEHEFISHMLTRMQQFAKAYGVHVWFVAHPSKITRSNMDLPRPDGMAISGCYSDDTEVLTNRGWVLHQDLHALDAVACFDLKTEAIEYEIPSHRHKYPHVGRMHHWTGSNLDMLVTPNHRMVVKPAFSRKKIKGSIITGRPRVWDENYQVCNSEDISSSRWAIPMAGKFQHFESSKILLDDGYESIPFWWYIGFWVAEGHVASGGISVCQADDNSFKPRDIIKQLNLSSSDAIRDYGVPTKYGTEKPMWVNRVYQSKHPEITQFIIDNCGNGCENKRLPRIIWHCSLEEKVSCLDGLMFGDGSINGNLKVYHTTSPQLADDVQRLAIECGYWAHISFYKRSEPHHFDKYAVIIRREKERTIEPIRNRVEVNYDGHVYCLTVSTGAYLTRRNGKMAICGNSMAWWAKADCGITVHRKGAGADVEISVWKCRYRWIGSQGETILTYNRTTGTYFENKDAF